LNAEHLPLAEVSADALTTLVRTRLPLRHPSGHEEGAA
jgi:hypothetical protein